MTSDVNLRKRAMSGLIWKLMEKIGYQLISVIVQVILARILSPEDYGLIAIIMVIIALSDVFILQGFTSALIQRKEPSQLDFSSVFFANVIISVILYTIIFFAADFIAKFYNIPDLVQLTRVLSLNIIIGAFSAVHNAILSRNLDFKKSFYRNISNVFGYGLSGILFAFNGLGVWSLVYARLIGTTISTVVLWFGIKWKPSFIFATTSLRSLFKYGSRVFATNFLKTFFYNLNAIIIGKFQPASELGFYQRGRQFPELLMSAVDGSLSDVMYPTLSIIQDNRDALKNALRRSLKLSVYITFPILLFLIVVSEPLTILLLTDKWLPSVPIMQLACIICMGWPLSIRLHALNAIGRSDVTFKLSFIQQLISIVILIITVRYGVLAIMYGTILSSIIFIIFSSYFVDKYLGYSLKELITTKSGTISDFNNFFQPSS